MISFCTTCKDRIWQLEETLQSNLQVVQDFHKEYLDLFLNKPISECFEFNIVAYNDPEVKVYIESNFKQQLNTNLINLVEIVDERNDFSCGVVKNYSHNTANGDILFNLDADNFIDHKTIDYLLRLKSDEFLKSINTGRGDHGRIGCSRDNFNAVGGYRDVGRNDDGDFIHRCIQAGYKPVTISCDIPPIGNIKI